MDLSYSPEELAFRDEVRGWLKENLPDIYRLLKTSYADDQEINVIWADTAPLAAH